MMDCWNQDRTQRPRFDEILKRLDNLIRTPEMLHDELVCYTRYKNLATLINTLVNISFVLQILEWFWSRSNWRYFELCR